MATNGGDTYGRQAEQGHAQGQASEEEQGQVGQGRLRPPLVLGRYVVTQRYNPQDEPVDIGFGEGADWDHVTIRASEYNNLLALQAECVEAPEKLAAVLGDRLENLPVSSVAAASLIEALQQWAVTLKHRALAR